MKNRMSRTNKGRQGFKVDSLLEKVMAKRDVVVIQPGFINLTFLGFNNKSLDYNAQIAQVETVLLKISHKKRKDNSSSNMQVTLGTADVPINPNEHHLPLTAPTISIPTESFNPSSGPLVKSYILLFRVKITPDRESDEEEPALKKRRSNTNKVDNDTKLYGAELTVYDKHNRCYVSDGEYDVVVNDFSSSKHSPKKLSNWDTSADIIDSCGNLDAFMKGAVLKFKLNWSPEASARVVDRPKPSLENKENLPIANNNNVEKIQIVYQFVYNNNSRQQTEPCEDLHCPWCSLNCNQLYTLLKHLKLCHSRFTFTYVPIPVGARIDVAINEMYDGSYTGSPHDLITQPSACAFSRNGPIRRASVTHILVCHPKRSKPNLSEFLELDDCEYDGQRPFITGHNRLYHHTTTCLPIYPKEMDVDSEGESDPEWLQNKTMMMIDEFTDVNEGEKELMKMWNLHIMKHGFVGDCQIPLACQMFVAHKGKELLLKNLYKNFVVHMCSLFDFGLVSAVCLYMTIQRLQALVGETGAIRNILKESRVAQMDNLSKYGNVPMICDKLNLTKTPNGRKTANVGMQRRKGTPTPCETVSRRKSVCGEPSSRKRLSMSLNRSDQKSS